MGAAGQARGCRVSVPSMNEDAKRVWDERYATAAAPPPPEQGGDPIHYTLHKFLYAHSIALPSTSRLDGWIVADVGERFLKPAAKRVLALGSGTAVIEEFLLTAGYAEHIVAYEMSENACAAAMERLRGTPLEGRLEMRASDVLTDNIPDGSFDVVFVQAAIHHFDRIDDMFALMHRVLKPNGLLMYDEYVGPDHHIFPADVMATLNLMNDCLEPRYRLDAMTGQPRDHLPDPSLEGMLAMDPSEGVHASRILPLTYQWFEVLQRRDFGGTLLRQFFTGILPNFDWNNEQDRTVARLLILVERLMLQHNVLPSYSTDIVARRRPKPLPLMPAAEAARIGFADWKPSARYGLRESSAPAPASADGGNIAAALRRLLTRRR